jgi:hypothetical protein
MDRWSIELRFMKDRICNFLGPTDRPHGWPQPILSHVCSTPCTSFSLWRAVSHFLSFIFYFYTSSLPSCLLWHGFCNVKEDIYTGLSSDAWNSGGEGRGEVSDPSRKFREKYRTLIHEGLPTYNETLRNGLGSPSRCLLTGTCYRDLLNEHNNKYPYATGWGQWPVAGSYEYAYKRRVISWLATRMSASQETLCSIEFVS